MEQSVEAKSINAKRFRPEPLKLFILILIGTGLIVSGYLLSRYQGFVSATPLGKGVDVCSAVFGGGCDLALSSSVSSQLGIPLAGWGVMYYCLLFVFLFVVWFLAEGVKREAVLALFVLSFAACLISIMLLALMAADPALFCPFCTVLHAINLILFFSFIKMSGYSPGQLLSMVKARVKTLFKSRAADSHAQWKLLGCVGVALVALTLYQGIRVIAGPVNQPPHTSLNKEQVVAEFITQSINQIPIDEDDARLGPDGAPAQVIVFSDFLCPACGYFSNVVEELNGRFEGKMQVIFKHFPLGTACNPYLTTDIHPGACEAAWAAEAAGQQGKFWEYHNALFSSDLINGQKTVSSIALALGLDQQRFETYRTSRTALAKVERTIEQAIDLGIDATPAVFLNGRRVHDLSAASLQVLIDHETAAMPSVPSGQVRLRPEVGQTPQ